jgi:putative ABC transport system ATP-binding protein
MGSSGSGQEHLLNIIGILDNTTAASTSWMACLIKGQNETESAVLRSKYIGFVFQSFNLITFKNAV